LNRILHEKNIQNFLRNIDNPSAFDFTKLNEENLNKALSAEPKSKVEFTHGTMTGYNRFCPEISFNCEESRRNAHFADSLKFEFELREIFRKQSHLGDKPTRIQNDIFQALSLNSHVFVNCFGHDERVLALFTYLKVCLMKDGKLEEDEKYVTFLAERKSRKKILSIAKMVGVMSHIDWIWIDKTNRIYTMGSKGDVKMDTNFFKAKVNMRFFVIIDFNCVD
jgi:hypothetical protein